MPTEKNKQIANYIEQSNIVHKIDPEKLDDIILTENMNEMFDLEGSLSASYYACKVSADKKKFKEKHNQVAEHCNRIAGKDIFILF